MHNLQDRIAALEKRQVSLLDHAVHLHSTLEKFDRDTTVFNDWTYDMLLDVSHRMTLYSDAATSLLSRSKENPLPPGSEKGEHENESTRLKALGDRARTTAQYTGSVAPSRFRIRWSTFLRWMAASGVLGCLVWGYRKWSGRKKRRIKDL